MACTASSMRGAVAPAIDALSGVHVRIFLTMEGVTPEYIAAPLANECAAGRVPRA